MRIMSLTGNDNLSGNLKLCRETFIPHPFRRQLLLLCKCSPVHLFISGFSGNFPQWMARRNRFKRKKFPFNFTQERRLARQLNFTEIRKKIVLNTISWQANKLSFSSSCNLPNSIPFIIGKF